MAMLHLFFLAMWAGVVLAEIAIETIGVRRPEARRFVADAHYAIDLFIEVPLLIGVVVTGAWLMRNAVWDTASAFKFACGGAAIVANLICVALVVARYRGATTTRGIFGTAIFGIPPALVALYLGLSRVL